MKIYDELSEARAQITRAMLAKDREFAGGRGDERWVRVCLRRAIEALERAERIALGHRAAARAAEIAELPQRGNGGAA